MDSADSAPTQQPVISPEAILDRHEQMLQHINQQLAALTQAIAQRIPLVSPPTPSPPVSSQLPAHEPPMPRPSAPSTSAHSEPPELSLPVLEPFSGEFHKTVRFLTQLTLQFRQLRRTYETDEAKIAFFVQLLRGQALNWAQAVIRTDP